MRLRPHLLPVLLLVATACAADDSTAQPADDSTEAGSALIVTTTVMPNTNASPPSTDATVADPPSTPPTTDRLGAASTAPPTSPPATTPATTTPPTTAPPVVGDPVVTSEVVAEFDRPIDLTFREGDPAMFVVEQGGRVVRFDGSTATTVLDIGDRVSRGGEQGLLGLAFAPDAGRAYVNFTNGAGNTVIAEFEVLPEGILDPASERTVLEIGQPFDNHNAGDLAFGPDGYLYITLGDGGSGGDPGREASDPTTLLGSLLRIDPDPTVDTAYGIPPDNPFVGGTLDGVAGAPEVWAWGLRNPWRIAFDPTNGDLWIPDVGQNRFEEVNLATAVDGLAAARGVDFGWSALEGTARFNDDVPDDGLSQLPALTYEHGSDGCSVSGGAPYRGTMIPELAPAFVYSDFCSGIIWALDLAGGRNLTLLTGFDRVASVRADPAGELYVLEWSGQVHRLVPG